MLIEKRKVNILLKSQAMKNGLWLYALQFFNTIIPLVTLPYITRILGAVQYGVFSIVLNIITYVQVVIEYGFGLSATRRVAIADEEDNLNKLFSQVFFSRCLLFTISMLGLSAYLVCSNISHIEKKCYLVLGFMLVGYCFQMNWLFQGKQEMKFISVTNVVSRMISTVAIFIFVNDSSDIIVYCMLYSLSPLLSNVLGMIIALKHYSIKIVVVSFKDIINALKEGMYVFFTQLSSKVFGSIGITFLGIFSTKYEAGVYSAIYKIPYMIILLWSPLSQVLYPISSRHLMDSFNDGYYFVLKVRKYIILIFALCGVIIFLLAKPISVIAFGEEYAPYYYLVYPLLIWVLMGINNNFLGVQILVGSGNDKGYSKCFQISVVVTVVLNMGLIYLFDVIGASLAPAISEMVLMVLLYSQIKKLKSS